MNRMLAWPVGWCVCIGIAASLAAEPGPDDNLEFVRVTVPAEPVGVVPSSSRASPSRRSLMSRHDAVPSFLRDADATSMRCSRARVIPT